MLLVFLILGTETDGSLTWLYLAKSPFTRPFEFEDWFARGDGKASWLAFASQQLLEC